MGRVRLAAFSIIALLPLGWTSNAHAQASAALAAPKETYDSLGLQIALLRKMKADERFISLGGPTGAALDELKGMYRAAESSLRCNGSDSDTAEQKALRTLLCKDIAYRIFLLDRNIPFWGGYRSLTPQIPAERLKALEALLADFDKLADEITGATKNQEEADIAMGQMMAEAKRFEGEGKGAAVRRDAARIEATAKSDRERQFGERLESLRRERDQIQHDIVEAEAEREAATAALDKGLISAFGSAVGAPPWVTDVATGSSPQKALKAALMSKVGELAGDPEFAAQIQGGLGKFAESAHEVRALVQDAQEMKAKLEGYQRTVGLLGAVVRKPTAEGLAELGVVVWENLPAAQRTQWISTVSSSAPVGEALALVASGDNLADAVKARILDQIAIEDANLEFIQQSAELYLKTEVNEASALYKNFLGELSSGAVNGVMLVEADWRATMDSYVRLASDSAVDTFTANLNSAQVQWILTQSKVPDVAALKTLIRDRGLAAAPYLRVAGQDIRLVDSQGRVLWSRPAPDILGKLADLPAAEIVTREAEAEIPRLFKIFSTTKGALRDQVARAIEPEYIEARMRRELDGATLVKRNRIWDGLINNGDDVGARLIEGVAAGRAASVLVVEQAAQSAEAAKPNLPSQPTAPQNLPDGSQAMAMEALKQAYPAVGAATRIIESFADLNAANDRLRELRRRLDANVAAESRIHDLRIEAKLAEELANKEVEYQSVISNAYQEVFRSYDTAAGAAARRKDREAQRVALRRALTFYIAERLREEYDLLDNAISLWSGSSNAPRDAIASLVRDDPQNLRLAVDPDIHLFTFLDRSGEGRRTDVEALRIHWRQLKSQADKVCTTIGCATGLNNAQILDTQTLSVCNLISADERAKAQAWSKNPKEVLRLRFFMEPSYVSYELRPFGEQKYAHRVIDARLGGAAGQNGLCGDSSGDLLTTAQTQLKALTALRHPGVAYVTNDVGRVQREVLLPRRVSGLATPAPFNTPALGVRWATVGQRNAFEGYGLFTEWEVEIDPKDAKLADIGVQFAYQYIDGANINNEMTYYQRADSEAKISPFVISYDLPSATRAVSDGKGGTPITNLKPVTQQAGDLAGLSLVTSVNDAVIRERRVLLGVTSQERPLELDVKASYRIERRCENVAEIFQKVQTRRREQLLGEFGGAELAVKQVESQIRREQKPLWATAQTLWREHGCEALANNPEELVR